MTPDLTQAERFLSLFGPLDYPFTFQAIYDAKADEKKPSPIFQMTLEEAAPKLAKGNAENWGVFFTVNALNLEPGQHWRGRSGKNVYKIRALFVDDDEGTLTPEDPRFEAAPPSVVVRSKNGCHYYWLLQPGEDMALFTPTQKALAKHFGTDSQVQDLPRVLRVAGFWHMKDPADPYLVTLVRPAEGDATPPPKYTVHGVLDAFKLKLLDEIEKPKPPQQKRGPISVTEAEARARAYVMKMRAVEGDHGDVTTFKVACVLRRDFNLTENSAWIIFQEWNEYNATPTWKPKELRAKFDGAESYGTHQRGDKLNTYDGVVKQTTHWFDTKKGDGDVY